MKKNVVLADNSYTIRRIVELSFSDEEDINLVSYESGQGISDKLLELKPQVVLVDIKLPEMNGYEVCKFINETEDLKNTKVFLIKGGFEPVDEEQLKDLKYEDFITKPFDSKALVITVANLLEESDDAQEMPEPPDIPSSIPEEISKMDDIEDKADSISFSDIHSDIESTGVLDSIDISNSEILSKEEVLPSEEITQGAGTDESNDNLSPESNDDISNPFEDETLPSGENGSEIDEEAIVKENIKLQERELDIDSLTREEINIQNEINMQKGTYPKPDIDPLVVETVNETEDIIKDPLITEEKDQLDPSLGNMNTTDLENVFSIKNNKVEPPLEKDDPVATEQHEESKPKTDTVKSVVENITDRSEEVKQTLEKLEYDSVESNKEEVPEEILKQEFQESVPKDEKINDQISDLTKLKNNNELVEKVEDKLTVSVKEVLWEIIPPLAEKAIKNEIENLKKDIEKEFK